MPSHTEVLTLPRIRPASTTISRPADKYTTGIAEPNLCIQADGLPLKASLFVVPLGMPVREPEIALLLM